MALCHSVVERGVALVVGGVQRAPALEQQADHGDGSYGCGAMYGILAAAVSHACRGRRVGGLEQDARHVQVLLGGDEVKGCLFNGSWGEDKRGDGQ